MADEKHEVLLRLRAIELLAYWEGRLFTNRLLSWFYISEQQASSDIKRYIRISGLVSESVAVTIESEDDLTAVQLHDRTVRPEIVR